MATNKEIRTSRFVLEDGLRVYPKAFDSDVCAGWDGGVVAVDVGGVKVERSERLRRSVR